MRALAGTFVILAGVLALPSLASADHPLVRLGERHYENARLERALAAFRRAERGEGLVRDDLITLLRTRALVHFAMGSQHDMETDLHRLATLEPSLELGHEVPPRVRSAFEELVARGAGRLALQVDVEPTATGVRIAASVAHDEAALTREVRLYARTGTGTYERAPNASTAVASGDEPVEYYAEAIGPGGAVLVSEGFAAEPRRTSRDELQTALRTETRVRTRVLDAPVEDPDDGDEGGGAGWWIVGGVAVVAAAIAVVLVATAGGTEDTDVLAPTADFP